MKVVDTTGMCICAVVAGGAAVEVHRSSKIDLDENLDERRIQNLKIRNTYWENDVFLSLVVCKESVVALQCFIFGYLVVFELQIAVFICYIVNAYMDIIIVSLFVTTNIC